MKLVINRCYGGFSLSHKAIMEYARLKGVTLYPEVDSISKEVYGGKATLDNPNVTVHYTRVPYKDYEKIADEEKKKPIAPGRYAKSNSLYFSDRNIPRDDPVLVQVVKTLGSKANSRFSKLEIVDIPDDTDWKIEEYDGMEHIAEAHRTWS